MNLEIEAHEGELKKLRSENELFKKIFSHTFAAEKLGDTFFICGESGEKDQNNLPKQIHICPAYGVDWFQIYERTNNAWGPEW